MERAGGTHRLHGRSILIIEDDTLLAMELETIVTGLGCAVLGPAPDIARALALLESEAPDAALLDLNLKGTPALPVAAARSKRGVPFVLVTGTVREGWTNRS